jgi:hypothetical protein
MPVMYLLRDPSTLAAIEIANHPVSPTPDVPIGAATAVVGTVVLARRSVGPVGVER